MVQRFEVELLEDAYNFIEQLDLKAKKKILQNMRRAQYHTDPKLFKKLITRFGNLEHSFPENNIDYEPSGINKIKNKR